MGARCAGIDAGACQLDAVRKREAWKQPNGAHLQIKVIAQVHGGEEGYMFTQIPQDARHLRRCAEWMAYHMKSCGVNCPLLV